MGMESYNIMLLPENVTIIRDNEYWRLSGTTEIHLNTMEVDLAKLGRKVSESREYVFSECIDVKIYEEKSFFQGFEIRGCLSYLRGGIEESYKFYDFWNDKVPLNVFVLNQKVKVESVDDLYEAINNMYYEKIKIFKKQYGDLELKVTSGNFYYEMRRRNKWYNKVLNLIRRNF